ncbi:TPA: glycosyltransferase family 4 protein [Photobacterium damselae]
MLVQIGSSWPSEINGGIQTYFKSYSYNLNKIDNSCKYYVVGSDKVKKESYGTVDTLSSLNDSKIKRFFYNTKKILNHIKQKDIICVHYLPNVIGVIPFLNKSNFILHFHGPAALEARVEGKNKFYCFILKAVEKYIYSKPMYITTLSSAFKDILIKEYGVSESNIFVIPGGVEVKRNIINTKKSNDDEFTLLSVRRLVNRVGVDLLVYAVAELIDEGYNIKLNLAGSGPLYSELEKIILDRKLQKKIILHGRVSDEKLKELYISSNLYVVPTRALEGFGMVVLESLSHGLPVIVTNIGGLPEIISGLSSSLIIDEATVGSIKEKIKYFYLNRNVLPCHNKCISYARKYSWEHIVEEHYKLYKKFNVV